MENFDMAMWISSDRDKSRKKQQALLHPQAYVARHWRRKKMQGQPLDSGGLKLDIQYGKKK
jgi:hypothetical protein